MQKGLHIRLTFEVLLGTTMLKNTEAGESGSGLD